MDFKYCLWKARKSQYKVLIYSCKHIILTLIDFVFYKRSFISDL